MSHLPSTDFARYSATASRRRFVASRNYNPFRPAKGRLCATSLDPGPAELNTNLRLRPPSYPLRSVCAVTIQIDSAILAFTYLHDPNRYQQHDRCYN
jgi:hypothetical protein